MASPHPDDDNNTAERERDERERDEQLRRELGVDQLVDEMNHMNVRAPEDDAVDTACAPLNLKMPTATDEQCHAVLATRYGHSEAAAMRYADRDLGEQASWRAVLDAAERTHMHEYRRPVARNVRWTQMSYLCNGGDRSTSRAGDYPLWEFRQCVGLSPASGYAAVLAVDAADHTTLFVADVMARAPPMAYGTERTFGSGDYAEEHTPEAVEPVQWHQHRAWAPWPEFRKYRPTAVAVGGSMAAVCDSDNRVTVVDMAGYDVGDHASLNIGFGDSSSVRSLAVDDGHLAAVCADGTVWIVDLKAPHAKFNLHVHVPARAAAAAPGSAATGAVNPLSGEALEAKDAGGGDDADKQPAAPVAASIGRAVFNDLAPGQVAFSVAGGYIAFTSLAPSGTAAAEAEAHAADHMRLVRCAPEPHVGDSFKSCPEELAVGLCFRAWPDAADMVLAQAGQHLSYQCPGPLADYIAATGVAPRPPMHFVGDVGPFNDLAVYGTTLVVHGRDTNVVRVVTLVPDTRGDAADSGGARYAIPPEYKPPGVAMPYRALAVTMQRIFALLADGTVLIAQPDTDAGGASSVPTDTPGVAAT